MHTDQIMNAAAHRLFVRFPLFAARLRRRLRRREPAPASPSSFLVVRMDARGDLVLTTPLFHDLKKRFPQAKMTVVTHSDCASILMGNPFVDEILEMPSIRRDGWMGQVRGLRAALALCWAKLRGRRFDYAISPRWDADVAPANLLCLLADARVTVGFPDRTRLTADLPFHRLGDLFDVMVPGDGVMHDLLRTRSITETLFGIVSDSGPEVFPGREQEERAALLLKQCAGDAVPIAVAIGASDARRVWPIEWYAEVINRLQEQWKIFVCVIGGPAEVGEAKRFQAMLRANSCLVAEPDLRVTVAVLRRCALFLGNDSGPAHMAAAAGCPIIVVNSSPRSAGQAHAQSPLRFSPYSGSCIVLQPETPVPPCLDYCQSAEAHCIKATTVEKVLRTASAYLEMTIGLEAGAENLVRRGVAANALPVRAGAPEVEG